LGEARYPGGIEIFQISNPFGNAFRSWEYNVITAGERTAILEGTVMVDIQVSLQVLLTNFLLFLPKLVTALITFIFTLVLASLAARSVERGLARRSVLKGSKTLITQGTRASVLIFGSILALEQVNFNVTGFIAGLGIVGFAIGFALQDIARNFVAGIILIIRQPFYIGQRVKLADYHGIVTEINLRDTVIKTADGEKVILPNSSVFNNPIVNFSDLPLCRKSIIFQLSPQSDLEQMLAACKQAVAGVEGVLASPPVGAQVEGAAPTGMQIAVRFWVNQTVQDADMVYSQAVLALEAAARREQLNLPALV
jgi:small conductance mechanosensitive channel